MFNVDIVSKFMPAKAAATTANRETGRPVVLRTVLERGYIVHAYIAESDVRVVMLEHPGAYYQNLTGDRTDTAVTFYGYGATIEQALRKACQAFRDGHSTGVFPVRKPVVTGTIRPSSRLDAWLADNDGTLRVVQDEDGDVICRLESSPGSSHGNIALDGMGPDFRAALASALGRLPAVS